ncbi:MAG TPA: BolA/IbaG family iron-sulfur metabolism protein [Gammaproteobacteria bacterium]|nr:BolA/IbaG family iron-sulfur metabolism protein [Gammaproteobacteria bacterium]
MTAPEIKQWIESGLPGAEAQVEGEDGAHFQAVVTCPGFANKSTLEQHRMVYETLGGKMQSAIHALSLRTLVPK